MPLVALPELTRVLIVEDNDELRRQLVREFTERGYAVEAVRTLGGGLDVARRFLPHVILTELLLPDVRSYRFCDAYRSALPHPITICAVTRLPQLIFESARNAGFDEVFGKPVDLDALLARVERAVLERDN